MLARRACRRAGCTADSSCWQARRPRIDSGYRRAILARAGNGKVYSFQMVLSYLRDPFCSYADSAAPGVFFDCQRRERPPVESQRVTSRRGPGPGWSVSGTRTVWWERSERRSAQCAPLPYAADREREARGAGAGERAQGSGKFIGWGVLAPCGLLGQCRMFGWRTKPTFDRQEASGGMCRLPGRRDAEIETRAVTPAHLDDHDRAGGRLTGPSRNRLRCPRHLAPWRHERPYPLPDA